MRAQLLELYDRMLAGYGPRHWWPGETPFEVVVGAILTQSTAWVNVAHAIANLKAAGLLAPAALYDLPLARLAELIRPSGYFNQKAIKLRAFLDVLFDEYGGDLERLWALPAAELRQRLLAVRGIGPETADSICLYAAQQPCFVVDAYTRRVFSRLGLVAPSIDYAGLRALFADNLAADVALFNEYHALVVHHGKYICRKRAPLCPECVLADLCAKRIDPAERGPRPPADLPPV
ncbi:MAG: endonuclease III domain-containing protein [Chloroflexota bacterium]